MSSASSSFKQDLPPQGGYGSIKWMKEVAKRGPSGFFKFSTFIALSLAGYTVWTFQAKHWKRYRLEMQDARNAVEPLFLAEVDRMYLRRLRDNRQEEKELMKDVPNWKVGTLNGEPIFHNLRDRFIEPSLKEYLAHIGKHDMYDIMFERRKH
ncbi:NADH dehydrogenase [ubiquinone] 1 alpha subcomplex subunit 13 [Octopus bimaculoides]|uniref:NADH dehydrogenase [ubiquinone] 1 alpha subcomplex subunit 13 n=1 Tax=Octopus bimaculoides TaxID=37653 RepID=A0A0L8IB62_OCTBM|nr:NADH dehydrogenase [ubiquinone] 1 alpha subcomplex subunit 13 [Octopus bimaculoides]|eukprot:XP_014783169.1 PREDICTED: NADH dehydrogenase [ubiquinone] 1 alpha subcomplex subunit 13-like [Octopus bimaculoides]